MTEHAMQEKSERTKVILIDDHPATRQGIKFVLEREDDLTVCAEASDAEETRRALAACHPDLIILDLELKNSTSGLELLKEIRTQYPTLPVLIFSMHDEDLYAERALRAGAQGYIMKLETHEVLTQAIRTVLQGHIYVKGHIASKLLQSFHQGQYHEEEAVERLSDRELEVLSLLGKGYQTRHIAEQLSLSAKTIDTYKARLIKKLMLNNTSELVRYAIEWNQ